MVRARDSDIIKGKGQTKGHVRTSHTSRSSESTPYQEGKNTGSSTKYAITIAQTTLRCRPAEPMFGG